MRLAAITYRLAVIITRHQHHRVTSSTDFPARWDLLIGASLQGGAGEGMPTPLARGPQPTTSNEDDRPAMAEGVALTRKWSRSEAGPSTSAPGWPTSAASSEAMESAPTRNTAGLLPAACGPPASRASPRPRPGRRDLRCGEGGEGGWGTIVCACSARPQAALGARPCKRPCLASVPARKPRMHSMHVPPGHVEGRVHHLAVPAGLARVRGGQHEGRHSGTQEQATKWPTPGTPLMNHELILKTLLPPRPPLRPPATAHGSAANSA